MTCLSPKKLSRLHLYLTKRKLKFMEWICHSFHLVKRENIHVYLICDFAIMKYTFFASLDEINGVFIHKI